MNTTKQHLQEKYTTLCLEMGEKPKSVYAFCKAASIEELEFYAHYGSLDAIAIDLWAAFYTNAMDVLGKDKNFKKGTPKDKLLAFYFTFFEVLLLNRSYVLFALQEEKNTMTKMTALKELRRHFKGFASELIEEGNDYRSKWAQRPVQAFAEGAWVQLLFLMKFWINDRSAAFEKTDAAIEKSVQTVFALFDNGALDKLIDFGKFLWSEKSTLV